MPQVDSLKLVSTSRIAYRSEKRSSNFHSERLPRDVRLLTNLWPLRPLVTRDLGSDRASQPSSVRASSAPIASHAPTVPEERNQGKFLVQLFGVSAPALRESPKPVQATTTEQQRFALAAEDKTDQTVL